MQKELLKVLVCPKCKRELSCLAVDTADDGEIISGLLHCIHCPLNFPISSGIPRFVQNHNYGSSFGYQWNCFKLEQLDSANHTRLSESRFFLETGWVPEWMDGKWLLEAGCGAGRFLEIASRTSAQVVGLDLSNAVDAARHTLRDRKNIHFVQADIYELPFRSGTFDGCYSIGVIQHTPDPPRALASLPKLIRPGGRFAVTIYERRRWTMLHSKYWARRITRHIKDRTLLRAVKVVIPVLFPITEVLYRIPIAGKFFQFTIPVANYVEKKELTLRQRYRWALLDTFDMLAPAYDQPMTQEEAETALKGSGIAGLRRLPNPGLNLVGERASLVVDSAHNTNLGLTPAVGGG
jgi:SAM-dependent methyltransferase